MTLRFDVYAPDGNFEKTFENMKAAEDHFGEYYAHGDVSPDGINRVVPADKVTEEAVSAYRMAKYYAQVNPIYSGGMFSDYLTEDTIKSLEYDLSWSDGNGLFILREDDAIKLAMTVLCGDEPESGRREMIREGVVLGYEPSSKTLMVHDTTGEARKLSELSNREMVHCANYSMTGHDINEDEGRHRDIDLGMFVGQIDNILEQIKKNDRDGDDAFSAQLTGLKNHQELPVFIYASDELPFMSNSQLLRGSSTEMVNSKTGDVESLFVVTPEAIEASGAVPEDGVWIRFMEMDENYDYKPSEAIKVNVGDRIDPNLLEVTPAEKLAEVFSEITPEQRAHNKRDYPF